MFTLSVAIHHHAEVVIQPVHSSEVDPMLQGIFPTKHHKSNLLIIKVGVYMPRFFER